MMVARSVVSGLTVMKLGALLGLLPAVVVAQSSVVKSTNNDKICAAVRPRSLETTQPCTVPTLRSARAALRRWSLSHR
jgi:hypothetical protein